MISADRRRVGAGHAVDPLDAGGVRPRGVGAVASAVVPAVAGNATPGHGAALPAARRVGGIGFLRRVIEQHGPPHVVEPPAIGQQPGLAGVVRPAEDIALIEALIAVHIDVRRLVLLSLSAGYRERGQQQGGKENQHGGPGRTAMSGGSHEGGLRAVVEARITAWWRSAPPARRPINCASAACGALIWVKGRRSAGDGFWYYSGPGLPNRRRAAVPTVAPWTTTENTTIT